MLTTVRKKYFKLNFFVGKLLGRDKFVYQYVCFLVTNRISLQLLCIYVNLMKLLRYTIYFVPDDIAIYSASVVLKDKVGCFFNSYETMPPANINMYPEYSLPSGLN